MYRPFCDVREFNARIRNKVQKLRNKKAPTAQKRETGYKELQVALQASFSYLEHG